MRRWVKWTLIVVGVFVLAAVTFGAWIGYSYLTARRRHRRRGRLRPPAGDPAAGPVARSTATGGAVFDLDRRRATPTSADAEHRDLGRSTAPTSARRCGPAAASRCWSTSATGWPSDEHGALARHAPAGGDGRRPAPADRAGRRPGRRPGRIDQPAATLWYHPHPHGETAEHVYRGLAGMFILDDREATALPLPREYGVDDIPVIVQDKEFDGDRARRRAPALLERRSASSATRSLVNGTPGPYLDVTTERVRLRLLNASNARVYDFGFADDREFALVATDGGLLRGAGTHRPDAAVARRAGRDRGRRSAGRDGRCCAATRPTGRRGSTTVHRRPTTGSTSCSCAPPTAGAVARRCPHGWPTSTRPRPGRRASQTREFDLSGTHDQRRRDGHGPDRRDRRAGHDRGLAGRATPTATRTTSTSTTCSSRCSSVDGDPPPPELAGWKDTMFLPAGQRLRAASCGSPTTPTPTRRTCTTATCSATRTQGMMGQFVVVEPGEEAGVGLKPPSLSSGLQVTRARAARPTRPRRSRRRPASSSRRGCRRPRRCRGPWWPGSPAAGRRPTARLGTSRPVSTKPRSSRATSVGSQSQCGSAPSSRNSPRDRDRARRSPVARVADVEPLQPAVAAAVDDLGCRSGRRSAGCSSISLIRYARHGLVEAGAADHDRHRRGEPGEVDRGLAGGVAAADDHDVLALHLAGGGHRAAVVDAQADQRLDAARRRACGRRRRWRPRPPGRGRRRRRCGRTCGSPSSPGVERGDLPAGEEPGAEPDRLVAGALGQPHAGDAAREAEVVADHRAGAGLAADRLRPRARPSTGPRMRRRPRRRARPGRRRRCRGRRRSSTSMSSGRP